MSTFGVVPVQVRLLTCFVIMFWNAWGTWVERECCLAWFYKEDRAWGIWGSVFGESLEMTGEGLSGMV